MVRVDDNGFRNGAHRRLRRVAQGCLFVDHDLLKFQSSTVFSQLNFHGVLRSGTACYRRGFFRRQDVDHTYFGICFQGSFLVDRFDGSIDRQGHIDGMGVNTHWYRWCRLFGMSGAGHPVDVADGVLHSMGFLVVVVGLGFFGGGVRFHHGQHGGEVVDVFVEHWE